MQKKHPRPLTLVILDGWGYREEKDDNAIAAAHKPNFDSMWEHYPHTLLSGSGRCVGLPSGQMGNSEVGHLNMGAGRILNQDFTRIDMSIENGEFFENPTLIQALTQAKKAHKAVHIMGLLSPGGVHSHERHIHALVELAAEQAMTDVFLHAFLDGRDTPPRSAMASLLALNNTCKRLNCGQIISMIGRYYSMDRDKRWERVREAYDLVTTGKAHYHAPDVQQGLELAYNRGETDEFVQATSIRSDEAAPITIQDGDLVIFMNFRSDRARELTQAFIDPDFQEFKRANWPKLSAFVCLSEYDERFSLPTVFPSQPPKHILAECLSTAGYRQLRIAETEKYAHVTFFFNGGVETAYPGEERILIPSPRVATYDLQPEMSAQALTERLVEAIHDQHHDVIICNFANADMVGHTGNFAATVKAIESIDQCLAVIKKALEDVGGELLITADHGNAEKMVDHTTNQAHTAHTSEPVPFIYVGRRSKVVKKDGKLSDIAPTMLYLLGLPQPMEMTGQTLVKLV